MEVLNSFSLCDFVKALVIIVQVNRSMINISPLQSGVAYLYLLETSEYL